MNSTDRIDYAEVIKRYPWLIEKGLDCIISPDIDGLLCGLLMSHYLGWRVVGFYECRNLVLKRDVSTRDCVFLDMEILRPDIRSVGHHLNVHDINRPPADYLAKMANCANPNLIRGFDRLHSKLTRKYPLGAIHFLMYVLENNYPQMINIKPDGLGPIFFADGVWKILLKYTDNVQDWFEYLHSGAEAEWWKQLKDMSVIGLIEKMNAFLAGLRAIGPSDFGHIALNPLDRGKLRQTLELISSETGWPVHEAKWDLTDLTQQEFKKEIFSGSTGNEQFLAIWDKNPLSLAMTDGMTIQYTLEEPNNLP
jgi:hypothetical protein